MQTNNITEPVKQTSNYTQIAPVMEAMRTNNDRRPTNSFPSNTNGTVQQNAHLLPPVSLYNAHGLLTKTNPNSLLGYA
jgi:hypothetical protein